MVTVLITIVRNFILDLHGLAIHIEHLFKFLITK